MADLCLNAVCCRHCLREFVFVAHAGLPRNAGWDDHLVVAIEIQDVSEELSVSKAHDGRIC
jgi:hypothetical protein